MGEHITLQFGNYSNHVGAHYWNSLQEVVDRRDDGEEYEEYAEEIVEVKDNVQDSDDTEYVPEESDANAA